LNRVLWIPARLSLFTSDKKYNASRPPPLGTVRPRNDLLFSGTLPGPSPRIAFLRLPPLTRLIVDPSILSVRPHPFPPSSRLVFAVFVVWHFDQPGNLFRLITLRVSGFWYSPFHHKIRPQIWGTGPWMWMTACGEPPPRPVDRRPARLRSAAIRNKVVWWRTCPAKPLASGTRCGIV